MLENASRDLHSLERFLREHLFDSVLPFWLKHAIDPAGPINNCIRDDGTVVNHDRWLWSQWRAVWVFSKLHNLAGRTERWLDIARGIYAFASRHGWDEDTGGWRLRLGRDGDVRDACDSIYVDAFAIYGLTEFAKATGADEPVALARRTADNALRRLQAPHDRIPHFPYPVPEGARVHGIPMIFSLVFWELGKFLNDEHYCEAALRMAEDVFLNFYRADRDVILERIAAGNREFPPPFGTAVVPGHVVEGMWFQIHIARDTGDSARIAEACRLIKRHMELGWDPEFGGIIQAIDVDGRSDTAWPYPDAKIWWPHTEALYALLLAYEHTREPWCLEWYDRVHEYSFSHFPVPAHGEWTQKLTREGEPLSETVALPVKDPFHLPRALIYCLDVLERLVEQLADTPDSSAV